MPVAAPVRRPVSSPAARSLSRPSIGRAGWLTIALMAVCLAGYGGIGALSGADWLAGARFFLLAGLDLILPGWLLARRLGPRAPGLTPLLTAVYGCALLGVCFCAGVRLGVPGMVYLPTAAAALLAWLEWREGHRPALPALPVGFLSLAALWALLCLFFALTFTARNAHPMAAGSLVPDRDLLWNVGNAEAFLDMFPPLDLRFDGVRFSYHYLTELLAAALALASGAGCYDVFFCFAGPLFLLGELSALYGLGLVFYQGRARRAAVLPVLLIGFQCASLWRAWPTGDGIFGNTLLRHLTTNINAQATAVVFFSAFLALFAAISRQHFAVGPRWWVAYFLAFGLFTLAKGPQAAIALCALAAAMVFVLLFQRPRYGRALLCLLGTGALFAGMYRLLYSAGANTSMVFSLFAMEKTLAYQVLAPLTDRLCALLPGTGYFWLTSIGVLDSFLMLPFQFVLWLRGVPAALRQLPRLDPAHILAHAATVGGFLAYHLFWHESSSQIYFALFAMLTMTLLAAEQLPRLRRISPFSLIGWLCGAAGLCTAVCMALALCRGGTAQLLRTAGLRAKAELPAAVTASDEAAAAWLRDNAPAGTVFATDRTSSAPPPASEDGISNVYTAFSGVQCYMEGWTYAMSNMGVEASVVEHRRAVVAALFDPAADPEQVAELCRREGITCLVDSKRWPGQVCAGLTPDYENADVAIYRIG